MRKGTPVATQSAVMSDAEIGVERSCEWPWKFITATVDVLDGTVNCATTTDDSADGAADELDVLEKYVTAPFVTLRPAVVPQFAKSAAEIVVDNVVVSASSPIVSHESYAKPGSSSISAGLTPPIVAPPLVN
eukprot:SAG31_NODE_2493_length_5611_cov_8.195755_7_plen_132_part_00